jgi:hypothetical protein
MNALRSAARTLPRTAKKPQWQKTANLAAPGTAQSAAMPPATRGARSRFNNHWLVMQERSRAAAAAARSGAPHTAAASSAAASNASARGAALRLAKSSAVADLGLNSSHLRLANQLMHPQKNFKQLRGRFKRSLLRDLEVEFH